MTSVLVVALGVCAGALLGFHLGRIAGIEMLTKALAKERGRLSRLAAPENETTSDPRIGGEA